MTDSNQQQEEISHLREENARLVSILRNRCESTSTGMASTPSTSETWDETKSSYSLIILGASGDLAFKKLFPAIFNLHCNSLLPKTSLVIGYARSEMSTDEFRAKLFQHLPQNRPEISSFIKLVHYIHGSYNDMHTFGQKLSEMERSFMNGKVQRNRMFYVSLPPSAFLEAANAIHDGCSPAPGNGFTHIVVEKPFGRDLGSSMKLKCGLVSIFDENQVFRIDHYLGKQMVMNLLTLRFANIFMYPIWNRQYISSIQITFKEDIGTEGRGGYFDNYGIIRDVMQNHLIQVMALVAMENPVAISPEDIRDEKVKVLRAVPPLSASQFVIGQYEGYLSESGVNPNSITPTYAVVVLHVNNPRWEGIPFILKCGKGLSERKAEIRIQFRNGFSFLFPTTTPNELVIRIQPNESVYLKCMTKVPGITKPTDIMQTELDLSFKSRFQMNNMPDAYEFLIRDVLRGDHSLFVRSDELEAAWKIFTPALNEMEEKKCKPIVYKRGIRGLPEADKLVADSGYVYTSASYKWPKQSV